MPEYSNVLPRSVTCVRPGEQKLGDWLIAAAPRLLPELVGQGVLGSPDLPAVLRSGPVDGELLAARAEHDVHRNVVIELIESLGQKELIGVVLAVERLRPDDLSRIPVAPKWLVDVVVRRGLSLTAAQRPVAVISGSVRSYPGSVVMGSNSSGGR
ncbi:hypothetical protein ACIBCU_28860 [Streptomyces sp. NPDC051064]|uniref:hypothetical protein n=1 Tax=Streptomyces sp. NPDC051064 TaxID=3365641 RepID=UPI0037BC03DC